MSIERQIARDKWAREEPVGSLEGYEFFATFEMVSRWYTLRAKDHVTGQERILGELKLPGVTAAREQAVVDGVRLEIIGREIA